MSVRGVPVQDLPENQDPGVAFNLNEVTGEITPLVVESDQPAGEQPKRRGRPRKDATAGPSEEATPDAAEGEGE